MMRLQGLDIAAFSQPGNWTGDYLIDDATHYGGAMDLALRAGYAAYCAYVDLYDHADASGYYYDLPFSAASRWGHEVRTSDTDTLAFLQTYVDNCIANEYGGRVLFHPNSIGGVGMITLADYRLFLDYVAAKVAAGTLVVMTPTQQLYATPV
jgi:hypothetical protein